MADVFGTHRGEVMAVKGENDKDTLVVLSSPHWIWMVISGAGFLAASVFIYAEIEAFTFDARDNQDIAVIAAAIFFLIIFFVLAFVRPYRENRLDFRRRKLSRDICTVVGDIRIDVPLSAADEAIVYHMEGRGQHYGIHIFMQRGNKFPIAVELPFLEAERINDKINAAILSARYAK
jgi:hypothetical protein